MLVLDDDIFARPMAPSGPASVIFICTGNICRSPLAEKLLRRRLDERPNNQVRVSSAGLGAVLGAPMQPEPAAIAKSLGAGVEHVARQISSHMVRSSTIALTMTRDQRSEVVQEFPFALKRTFTLLEFTRITRELPASVPGPDASGRSLFDAVMDAAQYRSMIKLSSADDIEDPYRRSAETHERVGRQIQSAVDELAEFLRW
jgi:protein-tyrosine phosphatase